MKNDGDGNLFKKLFIIDCFIYQLFDDSSLSFLSAIKLPEESEELNRYYEYAVLSQISYEKDIKNMQDYLVVGSRTLKVLDHQIGGVSDFSIVVFEDINTQEIIFTIRGTNSFLSSTLFSNLQIVL